MRYSPATTVFLLMKRAGGADDAHAEPDEALGGEVRLHRGDDALHVRVDRARVDLRVSADQAEDAGRAHGVGAIGHRCQGPGGNAAVVQRLAADLVALDEHHAAAERGCGCRDRKPARSGADDADVGGDVLAFGVCASARQGLMRLKCRHCHAPCSTGPLCRQSHRGTLTASGEPVNRLQWVCHFRRPGAPALAAAAVD